MSCTIYSIGGGDSYGISAGSVNICRRSRYCRNSITSTITTGYCRGQRTGNRSMVASASNISTYRIGYHSSSSVQSMRSYRRSSHNWKTIDSTIGTTICRRSGCNWNSITGAR